MKTIYNIVFALVFVFALGCDRDRFAELNSDPKTLPEPDLRYSMTFAMQKMYNNDYTVWFYSNLQYIYPWVQATTVQNGNGADFNLMGPAGGQNLYSELFPTTMDVRVRIDMMEEEEKASYQALKAITYPIQIGPAITVTDNTGSLVYTESGLAPYTDPPLLTPVYDNQETLFDAWLSELDASINILTTVENQFQLGNQDIIYRGDYDKWAKYCNLLKLKIAARLVNKNKTKALAIASEVANSAAGYMDALSDDLVYKRGVDYYGTGNAMWIGYGGKNLIDYMIENKDPRIRFIFEKNDFNAEVVQAFIDAGKALPPYVDQYVNYDVNGDFDSWAAPGEPWVRYHGAPVSPDAKQDPANEMYFNQDITNKIDNKTYYATSLYADRLMHTSKNYNYPTKPDGRNLRLDGDLTRHSVILGSAAETNLYLAEFKQLGASLPNTAQEYFDRGVQFSIERADALASSQEMPYYDEDPVYTDASEATAAATKLRSNEITDLLAQPSYDLSTDALEKIYIQQYINFMNTPNDIWTTVRRSGVPKKGSAYLAWETFTSSGIESLIPRRFEIGTPTEDDLMYANKVSAYQEQGFSTGDPSPTFLNPERLWFDIGNPAYGAGPN